MADGEGILVGLMVGMAVGITIGFFIAQYIHIAVPPLSSSLSGEPSFAVERGPDGSITKISVIRT